MKKGSTYFFSKKNLKLRFKRIFRLSSATQRSILNCHYCGSGFSFQEDRGNHILFACDGCRSDAKTPMEHMTEINEYTI